MAYDTVLCGKSEIKRLKPDLNQLNAFERKNGRLCIQSFDFSGLHFTSLVPVPSSSELEEFVSSATGEVQELLTEILTNTVSFTKRCSQTSPPFKHVVLLLFVIFTARGLRGFYG